MPKKTKRTPIAVAALIESCNYLGFGHPTTAKAFAVARRLTHFLSRKVETTTLIAHVAVGEGFLQLAIGDICVWDSENDDEKALSFNRCLRAYREEVSSLAEPFGVIK